MSRLSGFSSKRLLPLLPLALVAAPLPAAVSCELNNPAVDVPRLFPGSTSFKVIYFSFSSRGGEPVFKRVVARLGGVPALYAPLDVPYVLYEIYKGTEKIGYIHGVNQKGQFGVLEVFVSLDLEGRVKQFYLQRVAGAWANKFTTRKFGTQFVGMTLKDFGTFDFIAGKGTGRLATVVNPAPEALTDFLGVLRALNKNLILMDEFFYSVEKKKP
ncbi:MAG: hypothetical protein LWW79_13400 [Holophagaceae bacterium]|nr:hypothetical protein [Holophagaceae bacterium]